MIKKMKKKKKGFTLVELIVVIAILGILAGIAVPKFSSITGQAAQAAHEANIRTLQSAGMMYVAKNPNTALAKADSKTALADYIQEWPKVPSGAKTTGVAVATDAVYEVEITAAGAVTVTPGK